MHFRGLIRYLTILMLVVAVGCKDTVQPQSNLPSVYVYQEIYLNTVQATALNTRDGAWIYWPGGLKGLVIYRESKERYLAFDRNSTAAAGCQVKVDASNLFMVDTCSNSQFYFNGITITGTAPYPLRQYSVNKDAFRLIISN